MRIMPKFKCAESDEHVFKTMSNITILEVYEATKFFVHFNVPTFMPIPDFLLTYQVSSINEKHDMLHKLIDDMIKAYDNGHEALRDEIWRNVILGLRELQLECKGD